MGVSPDEGKIISWKGGHDSPNKIYLIDLVKGTFDLLTEDKNITVIVWVSNQEVLYKSQEVAFRIGKDTPPIPVIYKKFNIETKEKTDLFILTEDVRIKLGQSERLAGKNRLLYRTGGNFSTPRTFSELFVINLDGTNKIKLESVKDGLTIIGLVY